VARVTVRIDDLEAGRLPRICVKSGVSCHTTVRSEWLVVPAWTWILLPFGFVAFFIAQWCASTRVSGRVPVARPAWTAHRKAARAALVVFFVGVAFVVVCAFTSGIAAVFAAIVPMAGAVAYGMTLLWWPGAIPARRRAHVTLTRVHRDFARAVDEMYHPPSRDVIGVAQLT
jgi:hypothetical protein